LALTVDQVDNEAIGLSTKELEGLCRAIDRHLVTAPLAEETLAAAGLAHLSPRLGPLAGLSPPLARTMSIAVLRERVRRAGPELQLVWTGPEGTSSSARDTATVVRELFCRAQRSVMVAGYAFDHGADILEPLHAAMESRGVEVAMFLHVPRCPPGTAAADHLRQWESNFLRDNWRFPRRPVLYYDPRSIRSDSVVSLHAKCIVVDETLSLVTSANFTERGQDRNIEVGVQIEDPAFGRRLVEQFRSALAGGVFMAVGGSPPIVDTVTERIDGSVLRPRNRNV